MFLSMGLAEASTRFGFGLTSLKTEQPQPKFQSKNGIGLRFYAEHEFDANWSADLSFDGDYDGLFSERKGVEAIGLYAKYRFSTGPSSFYIKGGPNYSIYYTRSSSPVMKEHGVGVLGALGWQHQWKNNWAVGLEAWYTQKSSNNALGATLTLSYGVNWFN